jgi:tetraacyldisaccharide 4'-kinase
MLISRWLWAGRSLSARLARLPLIPPSLLYRGIAAARARAYRSRLLPRTCPPVPTVAVGNLTVGGSGKTPVAAWIARYYSSREMRPGVVLRGYGGDEGQVHRNLVSTAVVVEDPDRLRGARKAVQLGAEVLVLDDAYQRLDVDRDLNVAVVSAESVRAVRWTLPAGPWREGWRALRRADLVVVTRKRAGSQAAEAVAERAQRMVRHRPVAIARLGIAQFSGMLTGERIDTVQLKGARLVAAAGIADPRTFAAQCRAMGARVQLIAWKDHHSFTERDVRRIAHAGRKADYVVVTEKDAVKLRGRWPRHRPEPLVAELDLTWERGAEEVTAALDAAVVAVDELVS